MLALAKDNPKLVSTMEWANNLFGNISPERAVYEGLCTFVANFNGKNSEDTKKHRDMWKTELSKFKTLYNITSRAGSDI